MSSRLPQPGPDWKTDPKSWGWLFIITLVLLPAAPLLAALLSRLRAVPYAWFALGSTVAGAIVIAAILGVHRWRARPNNDRSSRTTVRWEQPRTGPESDSTHSDPGHIIQFSELNSERVTSLTLPQLQRLLFISGRPGSGKTTLLRAIARTAMTVGGLGPGPVTHTLTFDANRSLAEFVAFQSLQRGRQPIVLELGTRDCITPYQFPRSSPGGDESAAEAIRRAWFSFEREIPAQLRDSTVHAFRLLAASGYGFDQALRVLLSEGFRDEVLRRAQSKLSHHTGAWIALTANMPRSEWYRKFASTLARLFQLLENPATRLALSGVGQFSFDVLNDRAYRGRGLDIIVTTAGPMDDELTYFVFGILFSELASTLRSRLENSEVGGWPEIVILADEVGRYGGAEALLDLLSTGRNVRVKAAIATHSLMSLREELQRMIPVLAVNRIAGGEVGQGAVLTAEQLVKYRPDWVKTRGPDGRPSAYWSAEDQQREFQDWLQHAGDHEFAIRLAGHESVRRGRALADAGLFPPPSEMALALQTAARQTGRPVAEVLAELQRVNRDLDARFGPVDYRVEPVPSTEGAQDWRNRPDDDFAPHL